MTKSRKRVTGDDGVAAVHAMSRSALQRFWKAGQRPSLSRLLVELLNGGDLTSPSRERVERLIDLLRRQDSYKSQFLERMHGPNNEQVDTYFNSYAECSFTLNEFLRNYSVIPQFDLAEVGPMLFFLSAEAGSEFPEERKETAAVMCALQLADRGQIDSVRKCSCGNYFLPGRIDQHYCCVKCRVKDHQSSEEFKAKRRERDRKRYSLHRDGKVKEGRRRSRGTQKAR